MPRELSSEGARSPVQPKPLRIALFALTGFGNAVLAALSRANFTPDFVATRAEPGSFPYYDEEPLPVLAARLGVPCLVDIEGEALLRRSNVDVLLVATYHRILARSLLEGVTWPINLHPSLLPCYRGPNPFYWVIRNGEARSGVTAHFLTPAIDTGGILWSESLAVAVDETQGSLRRRLALLAAHGAVSTVTDIAKGAVTMRPQDEAAATSFPRVTDAERTLRPDFTRGEALRVIRACTPFPGALVQGLRVTEVVGAGRPVPDEKNLRIVCADGELVVQIASASA
jgi:methionyl-tRNA formyltransferase